VRNTATLLALVLALSCKKQESIAGLSSVDAPVQAAARAPEALKEKAPAPRMIVRNATMSIVVADTGKAVDQVTRSVESIGGYVSGSEVWREGELLRARLTLRVPSAKLTPALAAIRSASRRVEHETVGSEDVTQEYVDLESRLRNLEATENELRELLVTVRKNARKASEILEVHQQLVSIRGEIEVAKGRLQQLSAAAAMSKIDLDVVPDAITRPVSEKLWEPLVVVRDASRALLGALRNLTSAAIWIVIYIVPLCGILALVLAALVAIARRLRRRLA
jgi:hypothetical protein